MGLKRELKNEIGNVYGPWKVIERSYPNHHTSNSANWICVCMRCGMKYTKYGWSLRRNEYKHTCPQCGYKGEAQ